MSEDTFIMLAGAFLTGAISFFTYYSTTKDPDLDTEDEGEFNGFTKILFGYSLGICILQTLNLLFNEGAPFNIDLAWVALYFFATNFVLGAALCALLGLARAFNADR